MAGIPLYAGTLCVALAVWGLVRASGLYSPKSECGLDHATHPAQSILRLTLAASAVSVPFLLVGGLRWRVGTDYEQYARNYGDYVDEVSESLLSFSEPGIRVLALVSKFVLDDSATLFFLSAAVTTFGIIFAILQRSPMVAFSLALFVFTGGWLGSFNGLRQFLACMVILFAHKYAIERRPAPYVVAVFVACAFHVSALIAIAFYFIPTRRLSNVSLLVLLAGSVAVGMLSGSAIALLESFQDDQLAGSAYVQRQVHPLRICLAFVPILLYAILPKPPSAVRGMSNYYMNLMFVNGAFWLAAAPSAYLARFTLYTDISLAISLPLLLSASGRTTRIVTAIGVVGLYGAFWAYDVATSPSLAEFSWIFERPWREPSAGFTV